MRPRIPDREPDVTIVALGEAKPAGSKNTGVAHRFNRDTGQHEPVRRDDGRLVTFTKDSSGAAGKAWRNDLKEAAAKAMRAAELDVFDCALAVEFVFYRGAEPGPISKRTGEPTDTARLFPHKRPDVLKLARAAEDALTKIVWQDDAQIVREILEKVYEDSPPRLEVRVWRLPTTYGEHRLHSRPELALLQ